MRKAKTERAQVLQLVPPVSRTLDRRCLDVATALSEYRQEALTAHVQGMLILVIRRDGSVNWSAHGTLGHYDSHTLTAGALLYAWCRAQVEIGVRTMRREQPKTIKLSGKHAIGANQYAMVDAEDYAWLSQWKWKAKPNGRGNNVYAVRNVTTNGKSHTVRMHREVLGLAADDPRDVDHIDHNALNNTRSNLRAASRSENVRNARRKRVAYTCATCGTRIDEAVSAVVHGKRFCSERCKAAYAPRCCVYFARCMGCGKEFTARLSNREFCSDRCRHQARNRAMRAAVPRRPSRAQRLMKVMSQSEWRATGAIALAAGIDERDARRILASLRAEGLVLVQSGKPKRWTLQGPGTLNKQCESEGPDEYLASGWSRGGRSRVVGSRHRVVA